MCTGFIGFCQILTVPADPYFATALALLAIILSIRVVRWLFAIFMG